MAKLEEKIVNLQDLKAQYSALKETKLSKKTDITEEDQMYVKRADGTQDLQDMPNLDIATTEETIAYLKGELFAITYEITHGKIAGAPYIIKDSTAQFQIYPDEDYNCPESGEDIFVTNAEVVNYTRASGIAILGNASANVGVVTTCPIKTRDIVASVNGGAYSGDTYIEYHGEAYGLITPDPIHTLPSTIEVTNAEYEYDSNTGIIKLFNATGTTVTINVECVLIEVLEFTTCDWTELSRRCKMLEESRITTAQFCQIFKIDGGMVNDLTDFVGKTKEVNYDGSNYRVVVLDVQHDQITGSSKTNPIMAVMTFQFVDVVSDAGSGATVQYNVDISSNTWYDGSVSCNLRKWLTGTFSTKLDVKVRDALVSVNKYTYDGMGAEGVSVHDETIFVPSLADMASADGIRNSEEPTISDYAETYIKEGTQYRYYIDNLGDDDPADWSSTHPEGVQIKHDLAGAEKNWWLRTPSKDRNTFAWSIKSGDANDMLVTSAYCVAPIFCI